ncbi:hypothetical protein ACWDTP_32190 [Mycobacterium sp. NPDC003449]
MTESDEADATQEPDAVDDTPATGDPEQVHDEQRAEIAATGLGVDGEHGPLFCGVDLELAPGFHAIQMPGGWGQTALLLTLAGRLKPTYGSLEVRGDRKPRAIRRHCAIAAFDDIDELEETVTVRTVVAEQRRWLSPWYAQVPIEAGEAELARVFGELAPPAPDRYISELSDLELFLLRIALASFADRPILIVGDLEQVRDDARRAIAVDRLGAIATQRTVVVGATNPLGADAPDHGLHDHRILTGKD